MTDPSNEPIAVAESFTPLAAETEQARADATPRSLGADSIAATHSFDSARIPQADLTSQHIGRYRVLRLLGSGGFGRVYLAADEELRRQVAIMLVAGEQFSGVEGEAYLAEARALAALDHPHIVPVYDVGRTAEGAIYIDSKFIEGTTLHQHGKDRPRDYAAAAGIVRTLAEAAHHEFG